MLHFFPLHLYFSSLLESPFSLSKEPKTYLCMAYSQAQSTPHLSIHSFIPFARSCMNYVLVTEKVPGPGGGAAYKNNETSPLPLSWSEENGGLALYQTGSQQEADGTFG